MTCQSNSSQGRGHDRLSNWNPKNGGMLISQPVTSRLTNQSELCMSRLLNNQSRRISIYRLQRWPSLGFEFSVSSTMMTSDDPVHPTNSVEALNGTHSTARLLSTRHKIHLITKCTQTNQLTLENDEQNIAENEQCWTQNKEWEGERTDGISNLVLRLIYTQHTSCFYDYNS